MTEYSGFEGAAALLPENMRAQAALDRKQRETAEEIRLRAGQPLSVLLPEGETVTGTRPVTEKDIRGVLEIATGASAYASRESLRSGYVTARGGYRIGVCGSAVVKDGEISGFRELSSASIRIPRDVPGAARRIMGSIAPNGKFRSTLIVSPPGAGKTTLLRDIVKTLSDGDESLGIKGMRVALADERGEVACMCGGVPGRDVGARTDVIDGCPKAQAAMLLLRTMNPQVIALDEITAPEDIAAIECAANCGVMLAATAHAEDIDDLRRRRMYLRLLESGIFEYAVFIERNGRERSCTVKKLGG